jgi:hypothetical protein
MKKKSKLKKIAGIFLVLFVIGAIIITHVALKKGCEDLIKQKVISNEEIKNLIVRKNNLLAIYQNLTSEERIVTIGISELGMTIADVPISTISIDSEKIYELNSILVGQYD